MSNDEIPTANLSGYLDAWRSRGLALSDTAKVEVVEDWINNRVYVERLTFSEYASASWASDQLGGSCELV